MMQLNMKYAIAAGVAIVVIGGGSFYGGFLYGKAKTGIFNGFSGRNSAWQGRMMDGNGGPNNGISRNGSEGRSGDGRMANNPRADMNSGRNTVFGEVLSKSDTSLTVKMPNGGSRIVYISDKTSVGKSDPGALSDVTVGQEVMVSGAGSDDGTLVAHMVQIYPTSSEAKNQVQDTSSQN